VPSPVVIRTIVSPLFGANCYVVGSDGGPCVVVDAGAGVADPVRDLVAAHRLAPVAVLATHGHVDHTWDSAELCESFDVPFVLHEADAYRVPDPFGTLGLGTSGAGLAGHDALGPLAQSLRALGIDPERYRAPARIQPFATEGAAPTDLGLAGIGIRAVHAPGHTQGSCLFLLELEGGPVVLSGDVLFAGTIGRTDLPGGDYTAMAATLRNIVGALDPASRVLPGHGPATHLDVERRHNPFLAR
jgi:hydroxyacylglutathione hydrolase